MVLATTLLCSFSLSTVPPIPDSIPPYPAQNAADAWNEFFQEIEHVDDLYDYDDVWDAEAQIRYEELAPLIHRAKEIASVEECDWNLDYSQGFDLLLPHIGKLRKVQGLLQFSMQGDIQNGNTTAALENINAMLAITMHQSSTKTIIDSLVASSSFSMAAENENVIDMSTDPILLEAMLERVNALDAFDPFGIRQNVGEERELVFNWLKVTDNPDFTIITSVLNRADVDTSGWDMEQEIENYSAMMKKMEAIFQMTDQEEAMKATELLNQEIESLGNLTELLCLSAENLLEASFNSTDNVVYFKELLEQKIEMFRNPNSATYFLKAAEAYNEIDAKERVYALQHRDFTILEEPLSLFATACSMPPKKITLANSPETPYWIAPLYSLALDCIQRGTATDRLMIMEFVGHLSQQDRFAASILAAKLFDYDWGSTPEPNEPHLRAAFEKAKKQIPSADEFMLHSSADSERERLSQRYDLEESWEPNDANTLAMTLTLAKLKGIDEHNPEAWTLFVRAVGLPDTHPSFLFAEEEYNPELIEFLKLPQEDSFDEKLKQFRTLIGQDRYSGTNSRGR
jgi:hypothetical protein